MPPGQFAFQLEAYDLDNDPLTYQIEGTDAFYFSVDYKSGRVTLRNSLDREVRAEDGVRCPCLSGNLGVWMEGRACGSLPGPRTQLLEGKLSSQKLGLSLTQRLGLSHPSFTLTLTKSCLVSPQLQARLTITARVSDGVNSEVSAGARAGGLQGEGTPMDKAQGEGNWERVGDAAWLARVSTACQNCTQLCWPPSPTSLCPL